MQKLCGLSQTSVPPNFKLRHPYSKLICLYSKRRQPYHKLSYQHPVSAILKLTPKIGTHVAGAGNTDNIIGYSEHIQLTNMPASGALRQSQVAQLASIFVS